MITWKELRDAIDKMSEEEMNKLAQSWGEDLPLNKNLSLEQTEDDMYFDSECPDDGAFPKSAYYNNEDDIPSSCELIAKKGEYFINVE